MEKYFNLLFILITLSTLVLSRLDYYQTVYQSERGADFSDPDAELFGQNCGYSIGKRSGIANKDILTKKHDLKMQPMPLAWYMPPHERPKIAADEYIYHECEILFEHKSEEKWLSIGRVWGETFVYINGKQYSKASDTSSIMFPISGLKNGDKLQVISWLNDKSDGVAGFRGGGPLYTTNKVSVISKINKYTGLEHSQTPSYLINIYLSLALIACLAYMLGIRQMDLQWFLVLVSLFSLKWHINHIPEDPVQPLQRTLMVLINFYCFLSVPAFALSFMKPKVSNRALISTFLVVCGIFTICYLGFDPSSYLRLWLRRAHGWIGSGLMFLVFLYGLSQISSTSNKKRMMLFLFVCLVFVLSQTGINSGLVSSDVVFSLLSTDLILLTYSGFFFSDLIVYYRKELLDKAKIIESRAEHEKQVAVTTISSVFFHEFKRPITLLQSYLNILERSQEKLDHSTRKKMFKNCEDAMHEAKSSLADVRLLTHGSAVITSCQIDTIIDESVKKIFTKNFGAEIRFEYELDITFFIDIDLNLTIRALSNVLENAAHAIVEKNCSGTIKFEGYAEGDQYVLRVSNDGARIPEGVLHSIFTAFYTTKKRGSGIGLAIASKVMELNYGSLSCESDDEKTKFIFGFKISKAKIRKNNDIKLPANSVEIERNWSISNDGFNEDNISTIVLDDDIVARHELSQIIMTASEKSIKAEGIAMVSNINAAKMVFNRNRQSLKYIFADFDLGKDSGNGLEFLDYVNKNDDSIQCFMVSNREQIPKCKFKYFRKPLSVEDIKDFL